MNVETIALKVSGMTCDGCVGSVTRVLKAVPGVTAVAVQLTPGRAEVTYDPARTAPATLKAAIEDAGYEVVA
jgi:copper chaperone